MEPLFPIPVIVVLAALVVAAVTDLWIFKVPNLLTLPLLASGPVYHISREGVHGLGESLAGVFVGFGILFMFYLLGGMGGGDVKLLAAVGGWLGWQVTFVLFLVASLAGGLYALVVILLSGALAETWLSLRGLLCQFPERGQHPGEMSRVERVISSPGRRRRAVPFASLMALGLVVLLAWSWWLRPGH